MPFPSPHSMPHPVKVGRPGVQAVAIGAGRPLVIIAGPCVVESEALTLLTARRLKAICSALQLPLIFKASFDKANRTSRSSFRGVGREEALAVLRRVREETGLPVTTDVHLPDQAAPVAEVVDLLQVPAFLCRQTDLLEACGATGLPVNLKKGQFLSPWEMAYGVEKLVASGAGGVLQTERGSSFGYQNLVVDFRSLEVMAEGGWPVVFDATHSVQLPGAAGGRSDGQRHFVPLLARAAVAAGADALFLEVHPDPASALSDGPNMVPLEELPALLEEVLALSEVVRARGTKR